MWTAVVNFKIDLIAPSYVSLFISGGFPVAFRMPLKIRCDEISPGFKV